MKLTLEGALKITKQTTMLIERAIQAENDLGGSTHTWIGSDLRAVRDSYIHASKKLITHLATWINDAEEK